MCMHIYANDIHVQVYSTCICIHVHVCSVIETRQSKATTHYVHVHVYNVHVQYMYKCMHVYCSSPGLRLLLPHITTMQEPCGHVSVHVQYMYMYMHILAHMAATVHNAISCLPLFQFRLHLKVLLYLNEMGVGLGLGSADMAYS